MKKSTEELLLVAGGIGLLLFLKGRSASAAATTAPTGTKYDPTGGVYAGANYNSGDPTGGVYAGANSSDPTGGVYAGAGQDSGPITSPSQLSGYSYVQKSRRRR